MNPLLYNAHPAPHMHMIPYFQQRRDMNDEEDLASIALHIQKKRFYVDVKRNRRGIFMKIAEVSPDGHKARILLSLQAALEIKEKLKDLIDVYDGMQKVDPKAEDKPNDVGSDYLIKAHKVTHNYRRYYLDLKQNKRGCFVRLTMLSTTSRTQLAIPSQGLSDLHKAMDDLLTKWWDVSDGNQYTESKCLRVDNKILYFDSSRNNFGSYLRISEVRASSRTAITVPGQALPDFAEIIVRLTQTLPDVTIDNISNEKQLSDECTTDDPISEVNGDVS